MKSEGFLIAERALAQHSDMLAVSAPEPAQLATALAGVAARLERSLADALMSLLGEDRPLVACAKVETATPAKLHKMIDLVAVNYLFGDAADGQVLCSLDLSSALALTDQVFGGTGEAPAILPDRLPKATDLTLTRFAEALGEALGAALERPEPMVVASRSDVLGKIVRARDEEPFFVLRCPIANGDTKPWDLIIALRQSQAAKLLADAGRVARSVVAKPAGKVAAPFAKLPLPLRAVLAEMQVPVSRIAYLQPGDTLPLTIARDVPLMIEDVEIARGQVGTDDGYLALRLTKIIWNEKDNSND